MAVRFRKGAFSNASADNGGNIPTFRKGAVRNESVPEVSIETLDAEIAATAAMIEELAPVAPVVMAEELVIAPVVSEPVKTPKAPKAPKASKKIEV